MLISELPEDIRELALQRQRECGEWWAKEYGTTTDNLGLAFQWEETVEGHDFWSEYNEKESRIQTDDQIVR